MLQEKVGQAETMTSQILQHHKSEMKNVQDWQGGLEQLL